MQQGEIITVSYITSDAGVPVLVVRRTDSKGAGSLRVTFPSDGPPYLEQVASTGNVVWSTTPTNP